MRGSNQTATPVDRPEKMDNFLPYYGLIECNWSISNASI